MSDKPTLTDAYQQGRDDERAALLPILTDLIADLRDCPPESLSRSALTRRGAVRAARRYLRREARAAAAGPPTIYTYPAEKGDRR